MVITKEKRQKNRKLNNFRNLGLRRKEDALITHDTLRRRVVVHCVETCYVRRWDFFCRSRSLDQRPSVGRRAPCTRASACLGDVSHFEPNLLESLSLLRVAAFIFRGELCRKTLYLTRI